MIPALLIPLARLRDDPALDARGVRKLLVTERREGSEIEAVSPHWAPAGKCPVMVAPHLEACVFNQNARQERHWHELGTEMYMLIEGTLLIEVEGVDYRLEAGDMLVVNPGARHEVKPGAPFLCRVVTANCGGLADKHLA